MDDAIQGLRLVTVHPILVHVTLGSLPLVVLAYAVAAWRRSERWTFAADVGLVLTAVMTVATMAFGLVSNGVLEWPGGLGTWRWLHFALGIATAALLAAFAAGRLYLRARLPVTGGRTLVTAAALAVIAGFTGWIGGEVLVYRAGMAVSAAGLGALAPPITKTARAPRDILDSMHDLRAAWGSATATLASAVVESPTERHYATLARAGGQLHRVASWLAANGPSELAAEATEVARRAADLETAARDRNVAGAARAMGEITQLCAACHDEHRWTGSAPNHG